MDTIKNIIKVIEVEVENELPGMVKALLNLVLTLLNHALTQFPADAVTGGQAPDEKPTEA
jgi:hypothetical protein